MQKQYKIPNIVEMIKSSIDYSQSVQTTYKDKTFVFEPYLLFESQDGSLYVHGWKLAGEYEKKPPPHWASLSIEDLSLWNNVGMFPAPQPLYKPKSKAFHKVLHEWRY